MRGIRLGMTPDKLNEALKLHGRSQSELARFLGLDQSAVNRVIKGKRQLKADEAERIKLFFQGEDEPPPEEELKARQMWVCGSVVAGRFRAASEWPLDERYTIPVGEIQGYPGAKLYALKVEGRSMDKVYPDGSYVICCPVVEAEPREGDHVVVHRRSGVLIEATVKRLVRNGKGWELVGESTIEEYNAPIAMSEDGDESPEITAVVVGHFGWRPRPAAPLK